MKGYYTMDAFWNIYNIMLQKYPEFVGKRFSTGKTAQKKDIFSFVLGREPGKFYFLKT